MEEAAIFVYELVFICFFPWASSSHWEFVLQRFLSPYPLLPTPNCKISFAGSRLLRSCNKDLEMSRGNLVTIDFMGIEKGKDLPKEKCAHDLSWIKPNMMQRVLSLNKEIEGMQALKGLSSFPNFRPSSGELSKSQSSTTQLTIFYNGTVRVYDVSGEMAKSIFMLAGGENSCNKSSSPEEEPQKIGMDQGLLQKLHRDLPIARKQSLQRFLEKRKDRRIMAAPYSYKGEDNTNSSLKE